MIMNDFITSLILTGVLFTGQAYAHLDFQAFDRSHGLHTRLVWDIDQDSHGFFWFAGKNGLSRSDGRRFTQFCTDLFAGKTIRSMAIDDQDRIWVGTLKSGSFLVSPGNIEKRCREHRLPVAGGMVRDIAVTKSFVFFATNQGVEAVSTDNPDQQHGVWVGFEQSQYATVLATDDAGSIWIGTNSGLWRSDIDNIGMSETISGFDGQNIRALGMRDGLLHVATGSGLYRMDESGRMDTEPTPIFTEYGVTDFVTTSEGYWIATMFNGVFLVNPTDKTQQQFTVSTGTRNAIPDNSITRFYRESTGQIWLATFNNGVARFAPAAIRFGRTFSRDLVDCAELGPLYAFFEVSPDQVLLGSERGLFRWSPSSGQCNRVAVTDDDEIAIYAFARSHAGEILVATSAGLLQLGRREKGDSYAMQWLFNEYVRALAVDPVGNQVYFADARHRIFMIEPGQAPRLLNGSDDSVDTSPVIAMMPFGEERAVLRASGPLMFRAGRLASLPLPAGVEPTSVSQAFVDQSEGVWIVKGLKELRVFNKEQQLIQDLSQDPALRDVGELKSLIQDQQGDIWISSDNGMLRYSHHHQKLLRYDHWDGVHRSAYVRNAVLKLSSGKLLFGSRNGFSYFEPKSIPIETRLPSVVLSDLQLFHHRVDPLNLQRSGSPAWHSTTDVDKLVMQADQNVLGFLFAILNSSSPERSRLAVQLQGFDSGWHTTPELGAPLTYTNLPWGSYTLHVKVANKHGFWNEEAMRLPITIMTPWWARTWAMIGHGCALILLILAYGHLRSRFAQKRARKLEQEVQIRTLELAQQSSENRNQKLMIERLLARKEALFANVSHEFRTPLTLITGPLDNLLANPDTRKFHADFKRMRQNAERLLSLVEQLLRLSRLSEQQKAEMQLVDASRIVAMATESFRTLAAERQIVLSAEIDSDCRIQAFSDSIEIIIQNLLSNALKFTPESGKISVLLAQSKDQAILQVSDNGPGIPKREQEALFARFTRLARDQHLVGSGLGLAIVREVVEVLQGQIHLHSTPEQGTSVRVEIPMNDAFVSSDECGVFDDKEPATQSLHSHTASVTAEIRHAGANVLVVEDYPDMRAFVVETLATAFHCMSSEDGESGFALAVDSVPDIIVSDVMMPGMNGFELAKKIRADQRTSHIPIVLLTAKGGRESRIQGWSSYVDEFITKPFHPEELLLRIDALLEVRAKIQAKVQGDLTQQGTSDSLNTLEKKFVKKLYQVFKANYSSQQLDTTTIAKHMAVSERQLQRKLKSLTGQTPSELLRDFRLHKAETRLREGLQVTVVADCCGFGSTSLFIRQFEKRWSKTPKQFQMESRR